MVRKTLHSPFFTSVPRNNHLGNKPVFGGAFILPEDMAAAPKREIPASKFRLVLGGVYPFLPPHPSFARIVESITLTPAYLSRSLCFSSSTFSCMAKHCSKLVFAACNSFVSLRTIATSNRDKAVSMCSRRNFRRIFSTSSEHSLAPSKFSRAR